MPRLPTVLLAIAVLACLATAAPAAEPVRAAPSEVAHLLDRVLPRAQRVELRYLRHLGWRFERDPSLRTVVVDGGHPCRHESLAAAQAAGALRIRVPASFDEAAARAFGPRLAAIADGVASRCAYQHKLAPALDRAVARFEAIEATGKYEFPMLFELVGSPFWGLRLPESAWTAVDGVYVAYGSSARALEAVWQRGGVAECYTGQWLAVFGAQYELYGRRWFERSFAPHELRIGKPSKIKSGSVGRATIGAGPYDYRNLVIPPADQRRDALITLAEHGPLAYAGTVGIMRNTDLEGSQMNENFTILAVTPAAVEQFARDGGVRFLKREAARAWTHVNASMPGKPLRHFAEPTGAAAEAIDRILGQPAFSGVTVYVHPYGRMTFEELVRDKFKEDDTPPEFLIYRHGRESLLYRRYHRAWKARCARGGVCR